MGFVCFENIQKSYGQTPILKGVSLDIKEGEFVTLLGPSGCGKSTLLRILAGLETQDSGLIIIAGRRADGRRPKHRDVAMVFQSYALYPHMTVGANMAVPLRMRRLSALQRAPLIGRLIPGTRAALADIEREVGATAKALGIDHLLARKPGQLSGGQRQRVAVGRAMVRHPAAFLMDEPLSNLDAKLRVQMRAEIKELHQRLGVTFIYVTHDQSEAMTLSDRVAVMLNGELLQVAPPQDIYADPNDRRVAEFIGSPKINMLHGTVRDHHFIAVAGTTLPLNTGLAANEQVMLGIRPEEFHLVDQAGPAVLTGPIRLIEHMGSDLFVHIDIVDATEPLVARLSAGQSSRVAIGAIAHVAPAPDSILLFGEDGRRIRLSPAAGRPALVVAPVQEVIG